jgi:hypothetical protein
MKYMELPGEAFRANRQKHAPRVGDGVPSVDPHS